MNIFQGHYSATTVVAAIIDRDMTLRMSTMHENDRVKREKKLGTLTILWRLRTSPGLPTTDFFYIRKCVQAIVWEL